MDLTVSALIKSLQESASPFIFSAILKYWIPNLIIPFIIYIYNKRLLTLGRYLASCTLTIIKMHFCANLIEWLQFSVPGGSNCSLLACTVRVAISARLMGNWRTKFTCNLSHLERYNFSTLLEIITLEITVFVSEFSFILQAK